MSSTLTRRSVVASGAAGLAAIALPTLPALTGAPAYAATVPNRPSTAWTGVGPTSGFYDIRAVQYLLYARGFKVTSWESTYGPATRAAVAAFQRSVGYIATGTATPGVIQLLCNKSMNYGQNDIRAYAVQTLLSKHGYRTTLTTPYYGTQTDRNVRGFQVGHAIASTSYVGEATWKTLFAPVTSGAAVAMLQIGTGSAQLSNCGPVAMLSLLLNLGKTPLRWDGVTANRTPAVQYMRYTSMHVATGSARDAKGTEFPDFQPAFAAYGLTAWHGGIEDTLRYARAGRPSICGGDVYQMPYPKSARSPVSHWVTVLGWTGSAYLVADPLSAASVDAIHTVTEAQLRKYAATNPGHPISTAKQNSILPR